MFDIELKVNGALTMNIHGRNVTPDYTTNPFEDPRPRQTDDYTYEVYNVGSRQLICGTTEANIVAIGSDRPETLSCFIEEPSRRIYGEISVRVGDVATNNTILLEVTRPVCFRFGTEHRHV